MLIYVDESGNWDPEASRDKVLTLGAVVFFDDKVGPQQLYNAHREVLLGKHATEVRVDSEYDAVVHILSGGSLKKVAGYIERDKLIPSRNSPIDSVIPWGKALVFLLSPLLAFSPANGATVTIATRSFERDFSGEDWEGERQTSHINEDEVGQSIYFGVHALLRSLGREDLISKMTRDRLRIRFRPAKGKGKDGCCLVLADFLANLVFRHLKDPQNPKYKEQIDRVCPEWVPLEI